MVLQEDAEKAWVEHGRTWEVLRKMETITILVIRKIQLTFL